MARDALVTLPATAVHELAKWAYAAAHFDGLVPVSELLRLPVAGDFVADVERANRDREAAEFPPSYETL